jgi:tetratricopeptide (TPR) repeat protein
VAVARTIRTCSLFALSAALLVAPALAKREPLSPLGAYVQGRALDATGQHRDAAIAYGLALSGDPADGRIALRALRQAIEAGDRRLALRAARALEAQDRLPQDARLLLFIEDLQRGNWRGARLQLDRLEDGSGFDFLVPHLKAWTRFAARDGDPVADLDAVQKSALSGAYARETRALLLLALKRTDDALTTIRTFSITDTRNNATRIAAAAQLARLSQRETALNLLTSGDPSVESAKALLASGQALPGAIETASQGAGFLFARVSGDLVRDGGSPAALTLARLAGFADPDSGFARLVLAQSLAGNGFPEESLTILGAVGEPFGASTRELRLAALEQAGRLDEALAEARGFAAQPGATLLDFARLGDLHSRLKQPAEAAAAYGEAIARAGPGGAPWNLWLLYGGALDLTNDWQKAEPALRKAVEIAPDQPAALNHLGYAMLERGDDLVEATRLIARANALKPDDPAITDSLGWALFLRGRTNEAIALLERAVADEPAEATLSEHLGDAYWTAGRRVDARYAWQAALVQSDVEAATARLADKIANGLAARR